MRSGATPRLAIGSTVLIGSDKWVVTKYHKVYGFWEIMLRSCASGVHRSVEVRQLEKYLGQQ